MGCFMYVIFGSCKDITVGPTAIMSLMTAEYASKDPAFVVLLTFLTGLIILLLGILRLGEFGKTQNFITVRENPKYARSCRKTRCAISLRQNLAVFNLHKLGPLIRQILDLFFVFQKKFILDAFSEVYNLKLFLCFERFRD